MVTADVDGPRLLGRIEELAKCTATPGRGVTRPAWSPAWRHAADLLVHWAETAGASCFVDGVGNVIAERPGLDSAAPALVTGSHLDTVPEGGRLDGAYGVVAAWELLAVLHDSAVHLRHPLRAVAFVNEEGVDVAPYTGSRAAAGRIGADELAGLAPILADAGLAPTPAADLAWPAVTAFVELHIEQGPVLDSEAVPIGEVSAITGQQRGNIVVTGRTNHAGTTPMDMRRDALTAAAELVLRVEALAGPDGCDVATVGRLDVHPGAGNVVPGRAAMSFDLRSVDDQRMAVAVERLRQAAAEVARARRVEVEVVPQPPVPAVAMDRRVRDAVAQAAVAAGLGCRALPSGAGHDCAILAGLGPTGMIFVPSVGGVSHHFSESTPDDALVRGAQVLLRTIQALDGGNRD